MDQRFNQIKGVKVDNKQAYEPPVLRKVLLEVRAQILGTGCRTTTNPNQLDPQGCIAAGCQTA